MRDACKAIASQGSDVAVGVDRVTIRYLKMANSPREAFIGGDPRLKMQLSARPG
jgi:hypothetical protein